MEVTMREGLVIRQKYMHLGTGMDHIDREYDLWIQLPEGWDAHKRLRLVQNQSNDSKCVFRIRCSRLLKEQKRPSGYLETYHENEGKIAVGGWAVGNSSCKILVTGSDGQKIKTEVTWHYRQDIVDNFPELEDAPEHPEENSFGFEATFSKPPYRKINLIMTAEGQRMIYSVNLKKGEKNKFGQTQSYITKGIAYFRRNGLERTLKRCLEKLLQKGNAGGVNYSKWRREHLPDKEELAAQTKNVFLYQPLISIVVPLYRTPLEYLKELVASLEDQTYRRWELCLSDGSGEDSPLTGYLEELQRKESRIKVVSSDCPLGISENTNAALGIASGDFVAFADHDDLLEAFALYECVKTIHKYSNAELIYSDEDKVSMNGKEFFQPHFKSDFNIDLLCSMNYFCHLVMVKKELLQKVGGLDSAYDGAQDYDFVLRCVEQAAEICHVPKVLYHWRAHKDSTAENPESKRYAFEAGKRAVQAHYDRRGILAQVLMGEYPGLYRTIYQFPEEKPLISIIIPNKDHIRDLDKCVRSILQNSSYPNIEFVIVENNSIQEETFVYYRRMEVECPNFHVAVWEDEFDYSSINNYGVEFAAGDYLLFLNNDTEIINHDCLEELLGPLMREEVGAVGARLYYPDNTIQHAGVIIGFGGIAGHAFQGSSRGDNGYFSRIICQSDLSAVTAACMMVKRSVFEAVGGFDSTLKVAFNDVDFCLRVRRLGKLVVYNPYAELYHYESKSRGYEDTPGKIARFNKEADDFLKRWPDILQNGDPYYNPNLTLDKPDFSIKL